MSLLCLAALLPILFWNEAPSTADALKQAKIEKIAVAPSEIGAWKQQQGIAVEEFDLAKAKKLLVPGVQYRINRASATRSPWVNTNGYQFLRAPSAAFYYDAPGEAAPLAAAESFAYSAKAAVHTDKAGLEPLGQMLSFLKTIKQVDLPAPANIGFIDDGSPASGEFLNLLTRRNLLFHIVPKADPKLDLTVELGSKEYPKTEASNPSELAQKVRQNLTDEKRLLRIYGSEIVIGRLQAGDGKLRLHLISYAGAERPVRGVRVRVLGEYPKHQVTAFGDPNASLKDYLAEAGATEFTVTDLKTYAVVDLSR